MEIRIRGLSKHFRSQGRNIGAICQVDLDISRHEIFTLLGPSGCGKTTLLRCIVGLETPDTGEIAIGDRIVFSSQRQIFVPPEKRQLGMVFQSYAIWPHMTVFENLAYPLQVRGKPREEIQRKVATMLQLVKLEGLEDRPATQLSGGQQQRVALARALVAEPAVILFDEPLSNLDAKLREETRKELRRFLSTLGITAVYVTHDRMEALSLSDRIAVMKDGRVLETGSPERIYFCPQDPFVADFIGKANMLAARVVGHHNSHTQVDSVIGRVLCRKKPELSPETSVTLCIRPEFVRPCLQERNDSPNVFQGTVRSLLFLGESCEVEIQVGQAILIGRLNPPWEIMEGDPIRVQLDPDQCFILKERVTE